MPLVSTFCEKYKALDLKSGILSIRTAGKTGPGKLLMFGVRKNPKIRPQIRKIIALKSAHLDRAYHVISKKGNYSHFYNVRISIHPASRTCSIWLRGSTGIKSSHASSEHVFFSALSATAR
jgi:hypothetical protein